MKLTSLLAWLRGRRARLGHLQFVMYTRRGCHLCEQAWALLQAERRQHGFGLSAVDVDGDAELASRYGDQVPVVTVNGQVRFRGGVNGVLLRRLLRAEQASSV